MSKNKFNKQGEEQNLTAMFDIELVSGIINRNIVSVEDAFNFVVEICKEFCVSEHIFYDIIYKDKDDLQSGRFYSYEKKSPCLLKFDNMFYTEHINKKILEYIILESYSMVKSDIEKEKQHEEQVKADKEELEELEKKIYKISHRSSSVRRMNRLNRLLRKKARLQKRIDTPFSSKRVFGGKSLYRRINRFFLTEKNKKINKIAKEVYEKERKTNKNLTFSEVKSRYTYVSFTSEELNELNEKKQELINEFKHKRYGHFKSYGDAAKQGNRFFRIGKAINTDNEAEYYIIFQPNRNVKIKFRITSLHGYDSLIEKMYQMARVSQVPLTFNLQIYENQIQISYDPVKLYGREEWEKIKPRPRRIGSVDLNPDETGFVIADFYDKQGFKIICAEVFSVEELNELEKNLDGRGLKSSDPERKHLTNKRNYEIDIICRDIMRMVSHYRCETFAIEKLKFSPAGNGGRGREFNKLVNKFWCRKRFYANIKRECYIRNIEFKEVVAAYSSFVGNLLFRSTGLPDMCLAALEIGRRAYRIKEIYSIYKNYKDIPEEKRENYVLPDCEDFKGFITEAWNEFRSDILKNTKVFGEDPDLNEELEKDSKNLLRKIYDAIGTKMVRVHLDKLLENSNSNGSVHRLHTEKSHTHRIIFDVNGERSTYAKSVIN